MDKSTTRIESFGERGPIAMKILFSFFFVFYFAFAAELDDSDCQDCHDEVNLESSVHEDLDCTDCHIGVAESGETHEDGFQTGYSDIDESCGGCHEDVDLIYHESIHGLSLYREGADTGAAYCYDCHGSHNILPSDDPRSLVYPLNLAETCGTCHAKKELVEKYNIPNLRPVELFSKSYHAKELKSGKDLMAATCNDCHGVHNIQMSSSPTSTISHANIAKTCGKCHKKIFKAYSRSIHWKALQRGEREAPACVDCHGEHEILVPSDPNSPVSKRSVAEHTCARCHTDERIVQKYGLSYGKVSSYQDSYHGLAVLKGDTKAATCYDCHNAHEILPASDKDASINPDNLQKTCSKCHIDATAAFARSYTHQSVILAEKPVEYYVKMVYIILILVVIGGMIIHNGIIIISQIVKKHRREKSCDYIQRYTKAEVFQHWILIIAFFTLVVTGFALKFQAAFWAKSLTQMGLTEPVRSIVHRVAAVLLIGLSVWHIVQNIATKRGRQMLRAMVPGKKDLVDFWQQMKSCFRPTAPKPRFPRFDYAEKVEYWALIWGTFIMVATGFVLWFPTYFSQYSPPWLIKVSETIHYYEAWLASLAILIWHFFFVIFHPHDFPMNLTWLHGRMTVEDYQRKHPAHWEQIMTEVEEYKQGRREIRDLSYQAREYVRRHGFGR